MFPAILDVDLLNPSLDDTSAAEVAASATDTTSLCEP